MLFNKIRQNTQIVRMACFSTSPRRSVQVFNFRQKRCFIIEINCKILRDSLECRWKQTSTLDLQSQSHFFSNTAESSYLKWIWNRRAIFFRILPSQVTWNGTFQNDFWYSKVGKTAEITLLLDFLAWNMLFFGKLFANNVEYCKDDLRGGTNA